MKYSKIVIAFLLSIGTFTLNAQNGEEKTVKFTLLGDLSDEQLNNSGVARLIFVTDVKESEKMANLDIKNGNPFLLLMGGIAPVLISTDLVFEKKYGVYFYEFGCTGPENYIIIAYNKIVFEYLNLKKEKKWIKEVRKDVIGLKEWKRNYKRK